MNESSIGSSPEPFSPAPFDQSAKSLDTGGGCGRVALIGCGVVILLLGMAAVALVFKADDFVAWAMHRLEAEIVHRLPDDCTDEERAQLHEAFDEAVNAILAGRVDPAAMQEFMGKVNRELARTSGPIRRDQVRELIRLLEDMGRRRADRRQR